MGRLMTLVATVLLAAGAVSAQTAARRESAGDLTFGATDGRQVITRDIGQGLLLRVVKESSISQEHFGWRVEVVRSPRRRESRNLLYHSRRTLGAHPSQVYAWHATSGQFPNVRELDVSGYPVTVRVELIDPVAEGDGPESRFVSGEIRVRWGPKRRASSATE